MERFSASRAARLIQCVGSADLENAIPGFTRPEPDETDNAQTKGQRLHEILQSLNEFSTKDLRAMSEALAYVAELRTHRRFSRLAEDKTVADWLVTEPETTVDLVLYTKDELHIVDWKTGTIPVSPVRNEQLMFYALNYVHLAPNATGATLHIVQPWSSTGCESWWASADELGNFKQLCQDTEKRILAADHTLTPSDHCTFCPANPHSRGDKGRPFCPAQMQLLYPQAFDADAILNL